jgi:3-methyl-2-oxobutanoate hydroxymethyltransferase
MTQPTDSQRRGLCMPRPTAPCLRPRPMPSRKPISLPRMLEMRARGEKITMITAYDATFAAVADAAGIDSILVGDSLGMVCQGLHTTVGVSLENMRYHTEMVARGLRRAQGTAWLIGDLPFGATRSPRSRRSAAPVSSCRRVPTWSSSKAAAGQPRPCDFWWSEAFRCAPTWADPANRALTGRLPRAGQTQVSADLLKRQAHELQDAGASMLVLEMVPAPLSRELTDELTHCATIGIGAGKGTAGQVLVMHDMLGLNLGKNPKFVRNFMDDAASIRRV